MTRKKKKKKKYKKGCGKENYYSGPGLEISGLTFALTLANEECYDYTGARRVALLRKG